jgi:hypothetical protein
VKPFVFLGPTMPLADAKKLCAAHYLPPVRMGDVYALMAKRPSTIAIIDGTFQNAPAVWHKEILFALAHGVRVMGASSMGALRAAELHTFGMEGVGAIYEAFRDGRYEDDDEVAVAHAAREHGYRPLSEAMVNVRYALGEALRRGLIGESTRETLVSLAKGMFYPLRAWPTVLRAGREARLPVGELDALERYVRAEKPNAKRADAISLLSQLANETPRVGASPAFVFEATWFWNKMLTTERRRRRRRPTRRTTA